MKLANGDECEKEGVHAFKMARSRALNKEGPLHRHLCLRGC